MSKRILIVEDQEDNRTILRDVLSTVGYELIEALNGKDGVRLAQSERPDLILMDIQLPEMDGYEATQQIKSIAELKTIPIIAVTSYARPAFGSSRHDCSGQSAGSWRAPFRLLGQRSLWRSAARS